MANFVSSVIIFTTNKLLHHGKVLPVFILVFALFIFPHVFLLTGDEMDVEGRGCWGNFFKVTDNEPMLMQHSGP